MLPMPYLVPPVLKTGSLAELAQPVLIAGSVALRPWTPDDVPLLVEAYTDPAIRHWHARSMTEAEALDYVYDWPRRWDDEVGAGWAVEIDEAVVGQVSLRRIRMDDAAAEFSYWVLPAGRGQGVAATAVEAVTRWAFAEVGLVRLEVDHSTLNQRSCRVATKAGFELEGTLRRHAKHTDGWHDMHRHARLNPEVEDDVVENQDV
jgi:RimJ/RimL family protein N-acetyltransferase